LIGGTDDLDYNDIFAQKYIEVEKHATPVDISNNKKWDFNAYKVSDFKTEN
jgi:hypothetical protein